MRLSLINIPAQSNALVDISIRKSLPNLTLPSADQALRNVNSKTVTLLLVHLLPILFRWPKLQMHRAAQRIDVPRKLGSIIRTDNPDYPTSFPVCFKRSNVTLDESWQLSSVIIVCPNRCQPVVLSGFYRRIMLPHSLCRAMSSHFSVTRHQ